MTVQDLINRLAEYPADMPVRFCADDGYIVTDEPLFQVDDARESDEERPPVPALYIDIN
jgi:hypothetical protein